jgi:hypothetical protein
LPPPLRPSIGNRMTDEEWGRSHRLTASDPYADLEDEQNILELNGLLVEEHNPVRRGQLGERLEHWASYYRKEPHRGEIYDLMEGVVVPFLREQLGGDYFDVRIALDGGREKFVSRHEVVWDIPIVATTLVEAAGEGAGSRAPVPLQRPETIAVLTYDARRGELTTGVTWAQTNGVTTSVDWFGIEDLIGWPMLIVELGKLGAKLAPTAVRAGRRAAVAGADWMSRQAAKLVARQVTRASRAEWKALLALEHELAELANVKVALGQLGRKGFAEIEGGEALKQLFSQTLSELPRMAGHWPVKLEKRYTAEVKQLILKGSARTKLADDVARQLARGALKPETLERLPKRLRQKVQDLVETRHDTIREAFWRNIFDDVALKTELKKIGIHLPKRKRAAVLRIGEHKITITLDHVARKVEHPLEAFSPANLIAATTKANSVQKEQLVTILRKAYDKSVDEFAALGRQTFKGLAAEPQLAKELGDAIDRLPAVYDEFGVGWTPPGMTVPEARAAYRVQQ